MTCALSELWPAKRLRFITRNRTSGEQQALLSGVSQVSFLPMEAIGDNGQLDLSALRDVEEVRTGYTQFFDGDILIAKITPCFENGKGGFVTGAFGGVGFGTTELHVLTPSPEIDGRFLYYITAMPDFRRLGEASMIGAAGQKRVPEDFIRNFTVRVPPLSEQLAIVDYLNRETERIDDLIVQKLRLVQLLAQKRHTIISHAIMCGIDPDVKVRDSGVPWLGRIPAHWQTERARWLFRERDERSVTGEEELLTVSHITGVTPRSEKDVNMFEAETLEGYKICRAGDLVINTLWAWMGAMGVSRVNGIVSPAYNVYEPDGRLASDYIDALVRMPVFAQEVTRFSKGVWSSRLRLYPEGFFEVTLPVPPVEEQFGIIEHIQKETAKIDALKSATESSVLLLRERRGALISAGVRGDIKVA